MKHSLQLRQSQQLTLTPQLQQAIKLLQLSTLEINQETARLLGQSIESTLEVSMLNNSPQDIQAAVVNALGTLNDALAAYGGVHRLSASALDERYPRCGLIDGWRINVQFSDGPRSLDILVPSGFPWKPIRIAVGHFDRFRYQVEKAMYANEATGSPSGFIRAM